MTDTETPPLAQLPLDPIGVQPTIQQAFSAAMSDIRAVGKDGRNTQQGYNFRGVDAVVIAAGPAFRRHGIIPMPRVGWVHREEVEVGSKRTVMALVTVRVTYRFIGPAGDYLEAVDIPGEAMDSGDKAVAKAMSVAYRIALLQALAIPTDDPDPDEQSFERAPKVNPVQADDLPLAEAHHNAAEAHHNAAEDLNRRIEALLTDADATAALKATWTAAELPHRSKLLVRNRSRAVAIVAGVEARAKAGEFGPTLAERIGNPPAEKPPTGDVFQDHQDGCQLPPDHLGECISAPPDPEVVAAVVEHAQDETFEKSDLTTEQAERHQQVLVEAAERAEARRARAAQIAAEAGLPAPGSITPETAAEEQRDEQAVPSADAAGHDLVESVIEEVKGMGKAALVKALRERDLATSGDLNTLRRRLAEALLIERHPSAEA